MLRIYSLSDTTKPPSIVVVERVSLPEEFGLPKVKKHLIEVDARAPAVSFVITEELPTLNGELNPEGLKVGGCSLTFRNDSGLWTAEIGRLASGIRIPWLVSVNDGAAFNLKENCSQHSVCVEIQCPTDVQVRYMVIDEWQKTWRDYELTCTRSGQ
jgi:hypothetical protein